MNPVCSVCGMGGYWVAFSGEHSEYRCVNHIHEQVRPEKDPIGITGEVRD